MAPAYFRNMSGLLLAFVVLSTLAHGVSLLFSPEPILQPAEHRFGSTIISTVLAPAIDKPAAPPSHSTVPAPQPEKQVNETRSPATETKIVTSPKISNVSVTRKTEFKTNHSTPAETKSPQTQTESQTSPKHELITTARVSTNDTAPSTTESVAIQLEKQRNYLLGELQTRLNHYLVYPIRARKRGWQGEVMVAFNINERGQLNNVRLKQSSGYSLLDRSAITAIAKLDHIALPNSMGRLQAMELQLPVRYELRES